MRRLDGTGYTPDIVPLARSLRDGEVIERKVVAYDRGPDDERFLEVTAAPIRSRRGKLVAAVSVFTDVTARRRSERAMREFVTNAAHELQTPVAAILSATEVLQAGAKSRARERDRFLAHVQEQAERLTRLSRSLLVLARAQSGSEHPPADRLALRALLERIAGAIRARAAVPVRVECSRKLSIVTNPDLAEQALVNLAANAAKHTTSGTIVLAARAMPSGDAVIEVRDTGSGIPADEVDQVFERFYRIGAAGDGFGLGLAFVREAARALGGTVEVASEVGVGTTMRLVLPDGAKR